MAPRRTWLVDTYLYTGSAAFALLTAYFSTLTPHRLWGAIAVPGYTAALVVTIAARRYATAHAPVARLVTALTATATTLLLPLLVQATERATGRGDRAQEEVSVVEAAGHRLIESGTPYLDRQAIEALPSPGRLLAYTPYQPAMALLGTPRSLRPTAWWTDARVVFLLVTVVAIVCALAALRLPPTSGAAIRAIQAVAVLPICALTLATGGDDLPVLGLCLLALALAATGNNAASGIIIGLASCLKLIALPLAAVLGVYLIVRDRRAALSFALGAFLLPLAVLVPSALLDADSVVENVLRFPLGRGIITSPAASPLPGHLLASEGHWGYALALALLVTAIAGFAIMLVRRPPRTVAEVAIIGAIGLLIAIVLMPATRFGYLMYPIALLAWVPALRAGDADG